MKTSHLLLACCLLASVGALAGFTHAGLEIRGLGISAAPAKFAKDSAGSSILKDHKAVTVKENPAAKEKLQALGPIYPIAEPDLLELFMERINQLKSSGQYQKRFDQEKQKIAELMRNPPAVVGLAKAQEIRIWPLEASIPETLPESLLRQAASVEMPRISRELIFIDGTDREELDAAKAIAEKRPDSRIVLVNGSIGEASRTLNRRIFFDQGGSLTRLFGIHATPAILFNGTDGPSGMEFPPQEVQSVLSNPL